MSAALEPRTPPTRPILFGRSSSHFSRVARMLAAELQVAYDFRVVPDLLSSNVDDYGGNPGLRMPTLQTHRGLLFGALNIGRELARQSSLRPRVVWPEDLHEPVLANAQELTVQSMATEVALILGKISGIDQSKHHAKMRTSLLGSMAWLEGHARDFLRALPSDRDFSFLEITLFCLITHLEFRDVLPLGPYPELSKFSRDFAERPSARETVYRFDA
ncbi:glutathione S-transferase domain-containing protein [Pendulispora albinea]|uniref:Glutathione S-transferase domain-containing protein n=1 Tax=Pendulispora albinea TaxID=2741071 RepID=A0ABZ2M4Y8_9BACT